MQLTVHIMGRSNNIVWFSLQTNLAAFRLNSDNYNMEFVERRRNGLEVSPRNCRVQLC